MIVKFAASILSILLSAQVLAAAEDDSAYREELVTFLVSNPDIIMEALKRLSVLEKERLLSERIAQFPELFTTPASLGLGPKDAANRVIEFFDYKCAPCKAIHSELEDFIDRTAEVRIEMRHLPILSHGSELAARFALAVKLTEKEGTYLKAHDLLWSHRGPYNTVVFAKMAEKLGLDFHALAPVMSSEKVTQTINKNRDIAIALEILGTPAFVTPYSVSFGPSDIDALSVDWLNR